MSRQIPALILLFLFHFSCKNDQSPTQNGENANEPQIFQKIEAAQSGLDFKPEITETPQYNFLLDPYQYNGGGVAVFDADNDGLQDLFFTYRFNGCRLYRNKGGMQFEDVSEASGVSKASGLKTGAVPVDINADGWMDVYVCRTWLTPLPERRNLLFVNQKDGTFKDEAAAYGLDDLSPSQCATFLDYDLDGDLDLYVVNHPVDFQNINTLNYRPSGNAPSAANEQPRDEFDSDKFYENQNGKFVDVSKNAGIQNRAWGLSATVSDFNQDGWPDILVGNDFVAPDFLYINQKNGRFNIETDKYFRHTANHSMGCDIADLNNDALPDLFVADMLGSTKERQKALMSSMNLERQQAQQAKGYGDQQMRNVLQLNGGNGSFSEIGCLAGAEATEWSWSPLMADFDLDGYKDLFISSGVFRDLNDLDFFFYTADSINHLGGLKTDNFKDFANMMSRLPMANFMYKNQGAGRLQMQDVSEAWGLGEKGFSNGAAYADLDNDGDLDLVINRANDVPLLYENQAAKTGNYLQLKCKGTAQNPQGLGAKIRVTAGDQIHYGELQAVRGFYSASEPISQVGLGKKTTVDKVEIQWQEGKFQVLENLPANQRIVFNIEEAKAGNLPNLNSMEFSSKIRFSKGNSLNFKHLENVFEDFGRERLLLKRYSCQGPCLAAGDVDGDGLEDVFIGGAKGQPDVIFLQKKGGSFQSTPQPIFQQDKAHETVAATFFDADSDGDLDLYCVSGSNEEKAGDPFYQDRFYLNEKGTFSKANFPTETQSGGCVAAYDADGDGDLDLFVGGRIMPGAWPRIPRSFVFKNEGGKFVEATAELAPIFAEIGMVTGLHFADLDGDQQAELIAVGEWIPVQIFSKDNGQFKPNKALTPKHSNGFWNCIQTADLDGDGDLDLITGNEGLNTRLEASTDAPLRVYFGDFDGNGSTDPIVAYSKNGQFLPLMQRNELGMWVPNIIKKKYTRYRPFSTATMEDVLGKSALEKAQFHEVQTLATTWWENTPEGFKPHILNDNAQISCTKAIAVEDFDQDGDIDLLLVGNDSGNHVETGPYNASNGVLLLNDGKGKFNYLPNRAHGFWADGEVRNLVKVGELFLVGRNGGAVSVYE